MVGLQSNTTKSSCPFTSVHACPIIMLNVECWILKVSDEIDAWRFWSRFWVTLTLSYWSELNRACSFIVRHLNIGRDNNQRQSCYWLFLKCLQNDVMPHNQNVLFCWYTLFEFWGPHIELNINSGNARNFLVPPEERTTRVKKNVTSIFSVEFIT